MSVEAQWATLATTRSGDSRPELIADHGGIEMFLRDASGSVTSRDGRRTFPENPVRRGCFNRDRSIRSQARGPTEKSLALWPRRNRSLHFAPRSSSSSAFHCTIGRRIFRDRRRSLRALHGRHVFLPLSAQLRHRRPPRRRQTPRPRHRIPYQLATVRCRRQPVRHHRDVSHRRELIERRRF